MLKKIAVLLLVLGLAFAALMLTGRESRFSVQGSRTYRVPQRQLWRVLAAVDQWSDWWPGAESARLEGALTSGNQIRLALKGGPDEGPVRLIRVERLHRLIWERAGVLQSRVGTDLRLEATAEGTLLCIENYIHGPQAVLARITGEDAFRHYQSVLLENLDLYLRSQPIAGREKD